MNALLQLQKLYRSPNSSRFKSVLCSHIATRSIKTFVVHQTVLRRSCVQYLNFSRRFWETFPLATRSLHAKDGLDRNNYDLIYHSRAFNFAFSAQLISEVVLSVQILGSLYYALQQTGPTITHFGPFSVTYDIVSIGVLLFFALQSVFAFKFSQASLLRAYHKIDTKEYILVTLSLNPFKSRLIKLKAGDLKPNYVQNYLIFFGNFSYRGKKIFLRHSYFKNMWHYNQLVGPTSKQTYF